MHIRGEVKLGSYIGLSCLAGAGAVVVTPSPWVGWILIGVAVIGILTLGCHHLCEWLGLSWRKGNKRKMIALAGMTACGTGLLGFAVVFFWPSQNVVEPAQVPQPTTVLDLFNTDFPELFKTSSELTITPQDHAWEMAVKYNVYKDFTSNTKFIAFYIPPAESVDKDRTFSACVILHNFDSEKFQWEQVAITLTAPGVDAMRSSKLKFSGRVFIYINSIFDLQQRAALSDLYARAGMDLQILGMDYLANRRRGAPHH